jgi:hypothetical protein
LGERRRRSPWRAARRRLLLGSEPRRLHPGRMAVLSPGRRYSRAAV